MRIGICEDNKAHASLLNNLVGQWAEDSGIKADIRCYLSAESFLFSREDELPFDVLLLDIQMDKMTGIELAKKLREQKDDVVIIFITAVKDYVFEGYDVNALHYLLKPVDKDKLSGCLEGAYAEIKKAEKYIIINDTKVPLSSIMYVEAQAHYIVVAAENKDYILKQGITAFYEELGEGFMFCHRSYIVNLSAVKQIKKEEIILDNGKCLPVSRAKYKEVNEAFIAYYKGLSKL